MTPCLTENCCGRGVLCNPGCNPADERPIADASKRATRRPVREEHAAPTAAFDRIGPATTAGAAVILKIKWRASLNGMWRSPRRFCRDDVLIRFPVR
jgi:hypothetical protein